MKEYLTYNKLKFLNKNYVEIIGIKTKFPKSPTRHINHFGINLLIYTMLVFLKKR